MEELKIKKLEPLPQIKKRLDEIDKARHKDIWIVKIIKQFFGEGF